MLAFDTNAELDFLPAYGKKNLPALISAIRSDSFHVRYIPESVEEEVGLFSRIAYARGDLLVSVDEVHLVAGLYSIDGDFAELFRRGRHRSIRLAVASQRPAQVNKMLTSQASTVVFFQLVDPRDLAAAQEFLDGDPDRLKTLTRGQHIERRF